MIVTNKELWNTYRKGRLRRNWRLLTPREKALYRVAMAYTKPKKRRVLINGRRREIDVGRTIVEPQLVQKLKELLAKLLETRGMKIFKRGLKKAVALLEKGEAAAVFSWAPRLKAWLKDPDYIFWLGTVRY
jgi:hypothetical protein